MGQCGPGRVFYFMADNKIPFLKPPLSVSDQTALLQSRGLIIPDLQRAKRYLSFVGYYRLAIYGKAFQIPDNPTHSFLPGTTFDNVWNLYVFDRELRLLVMDPVERIEVAIRTAINNHMALTYGPTWYTRASLFKHGFDHESLMAKIRHESGAPGSGRNGDVFCAAYFEKYSSPALPPCWMVAEILPMGVWSRVYQHLNVRNDRFTIADAVQVKSEILVSWLRSISYTRNLCAHHALLCTRAFTITPKLPPIHNDCDHRSVYAQLLILNHFLKKIVNSSRWSHRLKMHIDTCPISISRLEFPENWSTQSAWS